MSKSTVSLVPTVTRTVKEVSSTYPQYSDLIAETKVRVFTDILRESRSQDTVFVFVSRISVPQRQALVETVAGTDVQKVGGSSQTRKNESMFEWLVQHG